MPDLNLPILVNSSWPYILTPLTNLVATLLA